jgi:hypothetical protein
MTTGVSFFRLMIVKLSAVELEVCFKTSTAVYGGTIVLCGRLIWGSDDEELR